MEADARVVDQHVHTGVEGLETPVQIGRAAGVREISGMHVRGTPELVNLPCQRHIGGEPPPWFTDAMNNTDPGAATTVVQAFPVLESFLAEADEFWRRTAYGRLEGEAFVITDASGRNVPVAPIAVVMEGRHFLLLHRAAGFDERQRVLQRAREQALGQEKLVKQIDGRRRPVTRPGERRERPDEGAAQRGPGCRRHRHHEGARRAEGAAGAAAEAAARVVCGPQMTTARPT